MIPRPPCRRLALIGAPCLTVATLAMAAEAQAAGSLTVRPLEASVSVEGNALVVEEFTRRDEPARTASVRLLPPDSTGSFPIRMEYRTDDTFRSFPAGAGCQRLEVNLLFARFLCAPAGIERFVFRPRAGTFGPAPVTLDVGGFTLPVQASLGERDDRFVGRPGFADVADGGTGNDELSLPSVPESPGSTSIAGERYFDDGVANDGIAGHGVTSNYTSFEQIGGSPGADELSGGAQADDFNGFGGADLLRGNGGADLLRGEGGNDRLDGGDGDDRLVGGESSSGTDDDRLDGGNGNDTLIGGLGIDTAIGGPGDDNFQMRDGVKDVLPCDPGNNTYDVDLRDDLPSIETCTASSPRLSGSLAFSTTRLDAQIRAGNFAAVGGFSPPPGPSFGSGAVKEAPNVIVSSVALVVRGGKVRVGLRCSRKVRRGCRGTAELRTLKGKRIAGGGAHAIKAGAAGQAVIDLPRAARSRAGARLVFLRVVERGELGPKTSGVVVPLVVLRG